MLHSISVHITDVIHDAHCLTMYYPLDDVINIKDYPTLRIQHQANDFLSVMKYASKSINGENHMKDKFILAKGDVLRTMIWDINREFDDSVSEICRTYQYDRYQMKIS